MSKHKIAQSTLWQLLSQAVSMVLGLLSVKLITTLLSQSLVGNYQTVYAYLQIFGVVADFGLYAVAIRELSSTKHIEETFGSIFVLRFIITFLSLATGIIFAWILPSFAGTPLPVGIAIAALVPFFTLLAGMFRSMYQVNYKMHFVFVAETMGKVVPVLFFSVALFYGVRESESLSLYYAALACGGAGSLILFLVSILFVRGLFDGFPRCTVVTLKRIALIASPYGGVFLLTTFYRQFDVTLIALLRPQDYDLQNAYYGVVSRITEIGYLIPTFLLNSALPYIMKQHKAGEDLSNFMGHILMSLLSIGGIFSLYCFFWARPIMLLLTRETYLATESAPGSDTALMLLSFSMFLSTFVAYGFYLLLAFHRWKPLLFAIFCASTLSILCNIFLIPLLGFVGACITSIIVHVVLSATIITMTLHRISVSIQFICFAKWVFANLLLGAALFAASPLLSSEVRTIAGGVVGLVLTAALFLFLEIVPMRLLKKS